MDNSTIEPYKNRGLGKQKCLKKNQNAPRPSEHLPFRGGNVKTFRWDIGCKYRTSYGI